MADLTDEQREAALREMLSAWRGVALSDEATNRSALAAALDALIAQGWGPVAEVRTRAEKEIAENADAIAAARAEYGQDDKTSVPGILATLRREVLRKAGWNAAEEDWLGALECLAQADAYAYADREIRERSLGGPVTEPGTDNLPVVPGVDSQVLVAAREMATAQKQQPEWLWYEHAACTFGFGRWAKRETGAAAQAPYLRADLALAAIATAEARGYRAGVEAALTASIQMADAEDGPEPTIERIVRLYYTGRISEWDLANSYADQFLAAIRALTPEKPKEAENGKC